MMTLTIKTDNPNAEIGFYDGQKQLAYKTWEAHRQLAETIHGQIKTLLKQANADFADIQGIVVFKGPGSFTGLRIGLSVANAFAYSLSVPIVATSKDSWIEIGVKQLAEGNSNKIALPEYGSPAHTTKPRK